VCVGREIVSVLWIDELDDFLNCLVVIWSEAFAVPTLFSLLRQLP
jgi:hypothetical protein